MVASEPNVGTQFRVLIPLPGRRMQAQRPAAVVEETAPEPPNAPLPSEPLRALYELAEMGDIGGILTLLAAFEQRYPGYDYFVDEVRRAAEAFDTSYLKRYLHQHV